MPQKEAGTADGTSRVGSERPHSQPGGGCGARPAGGATRGACEIPWVRGVPEQAGIRALLRTHSWRAYPA